MLISELFERDPLKLTQTDLDEIVNFYRAKRIEAQNAPAKGKGAKAAKADLGELGDLDL